MKKLFFTLCALCLCGTMWGVTTDSRYWYDTERPTDASEIYVDQTTNLYFYLSSGNAVITYINENDGTVNPTTIDWTSGYNYGNLTIPEQVSADGINYYNVTMIGGYAFYLGGVTGELIIPDFITQLGRSAFEGCTGITSVTLAYSETALQEENGVATANSFYGCSGIETVHLNRDVNDGRSSSASNYAYLDAPFSYLTSIETIYVGEEVTKIPYNMFNCNTTTCALTTVYCYATNHIPSLDFRSFGQHTDLTLYVYDELVETFEADHQTYTDNYNNTSGGWGDVFSNIQGMGEIPTTLEDGTYKDLETNLFFEIDEDTGVISIYHDEAGVYTDANLVVYSVDEEGNATAYTLPSTVDDGDGHSGNVTRVEKSAFEGSAISGHLVIPATINFMGENAFKSCTGLTTVTYEYSPTALTEENATTQAGASFHDCTSIETVYWYRDIVSAYSVNSCQQPGPFSDLGTIETIYFGPRVTSILRYAFRNGRYTTSLQNVYCYAVVPPTMETNGLGEVSGITIYVPQGTASAYEEEWTDYNSESSYGNTIAEMDNAFAITTHENGEGTAYATFYNGASDVELFNPDGDTELTAYVAYQLDEESDGLYIEIAEIGNYVPAGTGVIVETEKAGTYLAIATENGESYSGENDLYGFDTADTTVGPNDGGSYYFYLLSSSNDVVGFYWGATDGAAFICQAHRAYLALPQDDVDEATANGSQGISIRKGNGGEDTTGISSVESATDGATVKGIYTIQGVRVSNMNQPGLYIVEGKKVLVK